MKKLLFVFISALSMISLYGQEQGNIRGGFNLGLGLPSKGAGITGDVDMRYNVKSNINVGVKLGFAVLAKEVTEREAFAAVMTHKLIISDYYFNKTGESMFTYFVGGGLGTYKVANISFDTSVSSSTSKPLYVNTIGGMVRGGFEYGHFRMSLEYYLIPPTNVYDINYKYKGEANNNFLNATLGFYFGGGHWKKSSKMTETFILF